ncbi:hypothetical protein [Asticcacaulis sp. AC402]|uniref:hypothetical protein n=1 Tax=Asticcacaulis sp. AC402 TaxID=1282361 RepID=UPI0003C3B55F|nr:hypothetical protein [Asticcacaulis sp. AC402]ESQ77677.1 hypothetical protein ABAC402_00685 [Asticcacaulis sp. AC402]
MTSASFPWTDQVDFRSAPDEPDPLRNLLKASLVAGALSLALGLAVIGGKLAALPEIDPMADPSLVVDYAARSPAERGLLAVAPQQPDDAKNALTEAAAPVVRARQVTDEIETADLPELPLYLVSDIAAPLLTGVASVKVAPPNLHTGPRPNASLAIGDEPLAVDIKHPVVAN